MSGLITDPGPKAPASSSPVTLCKCVQQTHLTDTHAIIHLTGVCAYMDMLTYMKTHFLPQQLETPGDGHV